MAVERLYLRPESFYAEQDVDLRTGVPAEAVPSSELTTFTMAPASVMITEITAAKGRIAPPS